MSDFEDRQVNMSTYQITAPELSTISKDRGSSNNIKTRARKYLPRKGRYIAQPERLKL
jgi:hypothetical protein